MDVSPIEPSGPGTQAPSLRAQLPPGLTDIPFVQDRPRILRFEAGLLLDLHLRRLARLSGAIDRALALRLRRLRAGRGYVRLGFSLFRDYVRERLGVAERTGQELSRLGEGLERLPALDAALAEGKITWTAAVEVARVAGVEDAAQWVAAAAGLTVRALRERVRAELESRAGSPGAAVGWGDGPEAATGVPRTATDAGTAREDVSATVEQGSTAASDVSETEDPVLRLCVEADPATIHLWEAALDLCELVAGTDLGPEEGPEFILADFLSGMPDVAGEHGPCSEGNPPVIPGAWTRERAIRAAAAARSRMPAERLGPPGVPGSFADELKQIEDIVRAPVPQDPFEIDASMRRLVARRRTLDLDLARLLRNFASLRLAHHLGFAGFQAYVEERLGISARRAGRLVGLDRRIFFFPEIARAVRDGRIGTEAAWELCKVATPERTEAAWIERARRRTVVRLREEVRWVIREGRRGRWGASWMPPPPGRLPNALEEISAELTTPTFAGSGVGLEGDESSDVDGPTSAGSTPSPLEQPDGTSTWYDDAPMNASATWSDLASLSDAPMPAGGRPEDRTGDDPALRAALKGFSRRAGDSPRVRVEFRLRESAVGLWTEARKRIEAETGALWVSDAEVLRRVAIEFLATHLPLWFHEIREGDPVAVRDRFRCQVPGCTVRGGAAHHLRYRSQLGPDEPWNLLFVCYVHHILGEHRRRIRISGRVPERVVFELGIKPDGTALETFVNEERILLDSEDQLLVC